jgi:hypothetical protein
MAINRGAVVGPRGPTLAESSHTAFQALHSVVQPESWQILPICPGHNTIHVFRLSTPIAILRVIATGAGVLDFWHRVRVMYGEPTYL